MCSSSKFTSPSIHITFCFKRYIHLTIINFYYLSIHLTTYLSIYPSCDQTIYTSIYLYSRYLERKGELCESYSFLTILLFYYPSCYLSIFLSILLSIYSSIYLIILLSILLSIYLSIYLSLHLSIYLLFIYLHIYLSTYISLSILNSKRKGELCESYLFLTLLESNFGKTYSRNLGGKGNNEIYLIVDQQIVRHFVQSRECLSIPPSLLCH